ncbi:MAG: ABC transporter ATP-binding protein [Planctomycetota bacterium]
MIVEISDLRVDYRTGGEALTVINIPAWSVAKGQQVAISGPSGSGKSTLLHVLAGLLPPSGGTVRVCGQELTSLNEFQRDQFRARHVGVIFQSFNLLQGYTALENVLLGATFSHKHPERATARQLLGELGMSHRLTHYPSEMSLGEQQRVAIARALVKQPELILADEPTGSLDPRHAGDVVRKLRAVCQAHGCSLVVVSHQVQVVEAFELHVDFMTLNQAFTNETGPVQAAPVTAKEGA